MNNKHRPDRTQTSQWHMPALIVAAIFCFARGAMEPFEPDYWSPRIPLDYAAVVGISLLLLFLAIGLWGFYLHHPAPAGRAQALWRFSIAVSVLVAATVAASNFAEDFMGVKELGIVWVFGVVLLTFAMIIAGISSFWVGGFPKRVGGLLLIAAVGFIFMEAGGLFALGLALLALSVVKFPQPGNLSLQ